MSAQRSRIAAAPRFHEAFNDWLEVLRRPGTMPPVLKESASFPRSVTVRVFYGRRLALARGKPYLAGKRDDSIDPVLADHRSECRGSTGQPAQRTKGSWLAADAGSQA